MQMVISSVTLLATMTVLFAGGGVLLKRFADGHGWWWFAASACVYLLGNFAYSRLLSVADLAVGTVLSSCAQIVILCLVGHFVFSENMYPLQWFGVLCACIGVALISMPVGS